MPLMLGLAIVMIVLSGLTWQVEEKDGQAVLTFFGIEKTAQSFPSFEEAVVPVRNLYTYTWVIFGSLMFIFAAAFLTTRKLRPGVAGLYLSMPLSRTALLMAGAAGIFLVYFMPLVLAVAGIWLVTGIKTGIYGSGCLCLLVFFGLYGLIITALSVGLGTVAGNPSLPIVVLALMWVTISFVFPILQKDEFYTEPPAATILSDYSREDEEYYARKTEELPVLFRMATAGKRYIMPPLGDLTAYATALQYPRGRVLTWRPAYVAFGQVIFGFLLGILWFSRKDY